MTDGSNGQAPERLRTTIFAGLIGNVLEWYDFAVYGYFAHIIGQQFFPSSDPAVSTIAAFGAFAAGFLVRPIGGIVFGQIGDLFGRKRAMLLSVICMAVPTFLIAFLPTYASIGVFAPILIVVLRIVQGLSVGGEYTSSLIYLAEHAPKGRRGRIASWGMVGAVGGILLGSGVGALIATILPEDAAAEWGWRIPFALGIVVAFTGVLVRRGAAELQTKPATATPLRDSFVIYGRSVLRVIGMNIAMGVVFYAAFVYSVTYITQIDRLPSEIAFDINTASMVVLLIAVPVFAILSDRVGRRPMMIAGLLALAVGGVPIFELMHHSDPSLVFAGQALLALFFGIYAGGIVGANVESLPHHVRCTGLAFAYNVAIGVFGGTTPMVCAALIAEFGNPVAPGYYVAASAVISLAVVLLWVKETAFDEIDS
ncbi:MAG: MFS transporter [Alphaproteobacteria bacterium]|nr:MFS transporter [Alphaproteobacteria bacterium]